LLLHRHFGQGSSAAASRLLSCSESPAPPVATGREKRPVVPSFFAAQIGQLLWCSNSSNKQEQQQQKTTKFPFCTSKWGRPELILPGSHGILEGFDIIASAHGWIPRGTPCLPWVVMGACLCTSSHPPPIHHVSLMPMEAHTTKLMGSSGTSSISHGHSSGEHPMGTMRQGHEVP